MEVGAGRFIRRKNIKRILFRLPFYALFFILPILGMMNCEGWNEGSGTAKSCLIDAPILHSYADIYYLLITMSAFMLLIPLMVYVIFGFFVSEVLGRLVQMYVDREN
jgi:hypothetical protein